MTATTPGRRLVHAIVAALPVAVPASARAEGDEAATAGAESPPEQVEARSVARRERPPIEHAGCGAKRASNAREGARVTAGALLSTPGGAYARGELEYFRGSVTRPAMLVGVAPLGVAAWGGPRGGGVSAGTWGFVGWASPLVFATAGVGVDWLLFDRVGSDGGVGGISPLCVLDVGLSTRTLRVFVDARAQRRFHVGLEDHTQVGVGLGAMMRL